MKDLKQVLLINDFGFVNGGISRVALDSSRGLAERDLAVTFFSAVPQPGDEASSSRIRMESTGQREFLGDPQRFRALARAYWNRRAEKAVSRLADELDPETSVVHVHSWAQANSASIFAPLRRKKLRVVVTLHDYFMACPTGSFIVFPENRPCQLRPLSPACLLKNCDLRSRFHKYLKFGRQWVQNSVARVPKSIRNFIFVSQFSGGIFEKHLPQNSRFFFLPNPVDVAKSRPAPVGTNKGWAYVGRISPEKGSLLFAKAAAILNLDAVFIGDGEESDTIRKIHPPARMLGWRDRSSVLEILATCRGLVFPSLCLEGNPLSVTEAQALGLPVVVSTGNAATDAVVDGETGLVFRNNDPQDLADKIDRLDKDAGLRERMGRQSFDRYWREPAPLKRHVDRLLEIYRAVE